MTYLALPRSHVPYPRFSAVRLAPLTLGALCVCSQRVQVLPLRSAIELTRQRPLLKPA